MSTTAEIEARLRSAIPGVNLADAGITINSSAVEVDVERLAGKLGFTDSDALLPDALLRLLLWILTHSVYSVRVAGRDNIPAKGGALFVSNHMSLVDALLVIASTDRPIRFIMLRELYEHPLIGPFARILRCIPISSQQRPREMIHSLREAGDARSLSPGSSTRDRARR